MTRTDLQSAVWACVCAEEWIVNSLIMYVWIMSKLVKKKKKKIKERTEAGQEFGGLQPELEIIS